MMTLLGKTDVPVRVVALSGGPGGGKTTLLRLVLADERLSPLAVVTEEAIHGMRFVRMDPRTAGFQCALVAIQAGLEDAMKLALVNTRKRLLLTHRGTLDPCAFWQSFGNSRESFFEMTRTTLEDHYRRYDLVIHMETAAVRAPDAYVRYPHAHRPEDLGSAIRLDGLLEELWGAHPAYVKINGTPDVEDKLAKALQYIRARP